MARIRSIKPEFWSSPSVARASAVARLAFIAMWNWADDHGRGTANLKELEGFVFPNDDVAELSHGNTVHFRDVVAEVAECFDVVFYKAGGRPFYAIPSWDDHQRNERRAAQSKHPEPTDIPAFSWMGAETPSTRTVDPPTSVPGTGEQGNRGTGEQGNSLSTVPAKTTPASAVAVRVNDRFVEFWDAYGKKVGRGKAAPAFKKAAKKADPLLIIKAAHEHADFHDRQRTEARFIPHPATWLNEERWLDERSVREELGPRSRRQDETDSMFDAAMQRAIERDQAEA